MEREERTQISIERMRFNYLLNIIVYVGEFNVCGAFSWLYVPNFVGFAHLVSIQSS